MKHFLEIGQVDTLYIFAPKGYAGISVSLEAGYAKGQGKEIVSSEPLEELAVRAVVNKTMSPKKFIEYIKKS